MTVWIPVHCPDCYATDIIKHGKSLEDKQRYLCQNSECLRRTFILDYSYPGRRRKVKQRMLEMTLNSSGIRDIARLLQVSAPTIIRELKKMLPFLTSVNQKALEKLKPEQVEVEICQVEEAKETSTLGVEESELDEMWSFVASKRHPRWLWHAVERSTGQVLAYVFGRRKDLVFRELKKLLEPFGIKKYCTDGWGATREISHKTSMKWERGRHKGLREST